jgi:hypothetical protein
MGAIRDGYMTTYLIHHWGIVICALSSIVSSNGEEAWRAGMSGRTTQRQMVR